MKGIRKIKLSKNMNPFVGRVVRDGRVQNAFKEQIGKPVGACVSDGVKGKKLSGAEIHKIASDCAKKHGKGVKLKI